MRKATLSQVLEFGQMCAGGVYDRNTVGAILEKRIAIKAYRSEVEGGPFRAKVIYIHPTFDELKRRFPAYVDPDFKSDYKDRRFFPIKYCKAVYEEVRGQSAGSKVAFKYLHMNRGMSTREVLAEVERRGFRPAFYEELLGFAEKYPDEQRKFPIAALGSTANVRGLRYAAELHHEDEGGRSLNLSQFPSWDWGTLTRFLVVRKDS